MRARPARASLTAVNFLLGGLIVAAVVAVAVAAMLAVRRRAPEGSFFSDGDRASGVFGVLATGFSLLLGLIVLLAFTSYDDSKRGAEAEALQSAYDTWFDLTSAREEARRDRVHSSEGVIPTPLWRILFFIAAIIVVYMLFFADRGERAVTQGLLMGSVVAVIVATLLLIGVLDKPYRSGPGELRPVAMGQTLGLIDQARGALGQDDPPPCDAQGRPA
jgi:hypothetical protein